MRPILGVGASILVRASSMIADDFFQDCRESSVIMRLRATRRLGSAVTPGAGVQRDLAVASGLRFGNQRGVRRTRVKYQRRQRLLVEVEVANQVPEHGSPFADGRRWPGPAARRP